MMTELFVKPAGPGFLRAYTNEIRAIFNFSSGGTHLSSLFENLSPGSEIHIRRSAHKIPEISNQNHG
jgi:hypothetical protein